MTLTGKQATFNQDVQYGNKDNLWTVPKGTTGKLIQHSDNTLSMITENLKEKIIYVVQQHITIH